MGKQNKKDKEGFIIETIKESEYEFNPIALVSLKKAVKSFYSTYQGINRHVLIRDEDEVMKDEEKYYPASYFGCYLDSIIYFHHFFEITIKDLLDNGNNLLSRNFNNKKMSKIIYDLINQNDLIEKELDQINTVEFSMALERIKNLNSYLYPDKSFSFLSEKENIKSLTKLNEYRNKILHKGKFTLKFTELDNFIGGKLFPIIKKIFEHPFYNDYKKRWYNRALNCKIDVFNEIIDECMLTNPNHRKIAVLKEMGRAAYSMPILNGVKSQKMIEATASDLTGYPLRYVNDFIEECPICGKKSVVANIEYEDGEAWIDFVKCVNCSFELHAVYIDDMSDLNLKIKNYFEEI